MAVDVKPDPQALGENPLIEGLERLPVPATTLTIFGVTGDLAHRKLLPALYNLAHEGALPERFNLIGVARREMSDEEFRDGRAKTAIEKFSRRETGRDGARRPARAHALRRASRSTTCAGYGRLRESDRRARRGGRRQAQPRLLPLDRARVLPGHRQGAQGRRASTTTPTSTCAASSRSRSASTSSPRSSCSTVVEHVFREQQVFRIDHYLGKETVQNVMAFRFANFMFEPVWNRNYIDHIQITAAEDIGIGSRAGYYDQAGALRDLVQNHMLQLLTLVCMEPPASFEADKVRDEKVKVLQAITPPTPEEVRRDTVRAQYTAGVEARRGGRRLPARRTASPPDSRTETYAALRLEVHNWRWAGVPIFLRTGKRLDAQGDRDRRPAQAGAAPGVPVARLGRRAAQPARADDAAQRGRVAVAGREDPRLRACASAR